MGQALLVRAIGVLLVAVLGCGGSTRRRLLRVLGVAVPAAMVNGWYLLPDVAYASHKFIAHWDDLSERDLLGSINMVWPLHVFSMGRRSTVATIGAPYALMQNSAFVWNIPKPFNSLQFLYRSGRSPAPRGSCARRCRSSST